MPTILGLNEDDYDPDVAEQQVFRELGYLVASGSILWTARQCYVRERRAERGSRSAIALSHFGAQNAPQAARSRRARR